ncbi:hypothetical protein VFPPC_17785 [Pochonia chlamydosporia 170]|uniref:U-box domain-containing protein n=1 Tax=Pochonia chlamydosporia 170 TaxID=1380566 RepID=A0A219AR08_METCM|nr:hypothetical protein VFPPC_17785 [Pochonia chlamydosporia 170]OWT43039.1 hypothetical protein VFPPC_17785 [Pochonia chlamydosporia 170]
MSTSSLVPDLHDSAQSAVERWIDPQTNLPKFQRKCDSNLEERTVAAMELFRAFYPSITKASKALSVPYKRLWSRLQGCHPKSENGGNRSLFQPAEEREILC